MNARIETMALQVLLERRRTLRSRMDEFIVDPDDREAAEAQLAKIEDDIAKAYVEVEVAIAHEEMDRWA